MPLSKNYYISSDVSPFILSHKNLIHLGASTILQKKTHKKFLQKNSHQKNLNHLNPTYSKYPAIFTHWSFFLPFLSSSIYISYLHPAFGAQFIYEFISKSI